MEKGLKYSVGGSLSFECFQYKNLKLLLNAVAFEKDLRIKRCSWVVLYVVWSALEEQCLPWPTSVSGKDILLPFISSVMSTDYHSFSKIWRTFTLFGTVAFSQCSLSSQMSSDFAVLQSWDYLLSVLSWNPKVGRLKGKVYVCLFFVWIRVSQPCFTFHQKKGFNNLKVVIWHLKT